RQTGPAHDSWSAPTKKKDRAPQRMEQVSLPSPRPTDFLESCHRVWPCLPQVFQINSSISILFRQFDGMTAPLIGEQGPDATATGDREEAQLPLACHFFKVA
ncbi:MAG: hypothetical protein ACRELG_08505, partial [Gemmataceae bacterium]